MLINLHLLRFLAAMPVLAYHTAEHVWATGIPREGLLYGVYLVGFGGVDVFFVISGFIIWHTTRQESGAGCAWEFLRRRIARTFSGYWPLLLLALLYWYTYQPQFLETKNLLLSLTLVPDPTQSTRQLVPTNLVLPVAWTLIYEVYFYAAYGLLIAFRRQINIKPIIVLIALVLSMCVYAVIKGVFSTESLLDSSLLFTHFFSPYCLQFLAGCLIGAYYHQRQIRWPVLWLFFGIAMTVLLGWVNAGWFDGHLNQGYYTPTRVFLLLFVAMGFVLWALGLDQKGKQVLSRTCLLLGGSTYTLYLSHTLWLHFIYRVGWRDWLQQHDYIIAGYWLASLIIIALSVIYYQYAERPFHRGFRRVLGV